VEESEVTGDSGLGLPEDLAQVGHRAFPVSEQRNDAKSGRFGDRAERGDARVEVRSMLMIDDHAERI
jgi:hypothetical protein